MENIASTSSYIAWQQKQIVVGYTLKQNTKVLANSMAMHTGDDSLLVAQNRSDLKEFFEANGIIHQVVASQCHSDFIYELKSPRSYGWEDELSAPQGYDAIITHIKGVAIGIMTADCVPILLYDTHSGVVAAVHAGWRGSASRIAQKVAQKMQKSYGCSAIEAFFAPSIGRCCYEVDKSVADFFQNYPEAITKTQSQKYSLDLPMINALQLQEAGIKQILLNPHCTACCNDTLFSYRKGDESGRFLSFVALKMP